MNKIPKKNFFFNMETSVKMPKWKFYNRDQCINMLQLATQVLFLVVRWKEYMCCTVHDYWVDIKNRVVNKSSQRPLVGVESMRFFF